MYFPDLITYMHTYKHTHTHIFVRLETHLLILISKMIDRYRKSLDD